MTTPDTQEQTNKNVEHEVVIKKQGKKNIKGWKIVLLCIVCALLIVGGIYISKIFKYNEAYASFDSGNYEEALEGFTKLNEFDDSKRWADYSQAKLYVIEGEYEKAIDVFINIEEDEEVIDAKYLLAERYSKEQEYEKAKKIYIDLDDEENMKKCDYQLAMNLYNDGNLSEAYIVFGEISAYKDSKEKKALISNLYRREAGIFLTSLTVPDGKDLSEFDGIFDELEEIFNQAEEFDFDIAKDWNESYEKILDAYETHFYETVIVGTASRDNTYLLTAGIAIDNVTESIRFKKSDYTYDSDANKELVFYMHPQHSLAYWTVYTNWTQFIYNSDTHEMEEELILASEPFASGKSWWYWYFGWYGGDEVPFDSGIYAVELILVEDTGEKAIAKKYFAVDRFYK